MLGRVPSPGFSAMAVATVSDVMTVAEPSSPSHQLIRSSMTPGLASMNILLPSALAFDFPCGRRLPKRSTEGGCTPVSAFTSVLDGKWARKTPHRVRSSPDEQRQSGADTYSSGGRRPEAPPGTRAKAACYKLQSSGSANERTLVVRHLLVTTRSTPVHLTCRPSAVTSPALTAQKAAVKPAGIASIFIASEREFYLIAFFPCRHFQVVDHGAVGIGTSLDYSVRCVLRNRSLNGKKRYGYP